MDGWMEFLGCTCAATTGPLSTCPGFPPSASLHTTYSSAHTLSASPQADSSSLLLKCKPLLQIHIKHPLLREVLLQNWGDQSPCLNPHSTVGHSPYTLKYHFLKTFLNLYCIIYPTKTRTFTFFHFFIIRT